MAFKGLGSFNKQKKFFKSYKKHSTINGFRSLYKIVVIALIVSLIAVLLSVFSAFKVLQLHHDIIKPITSMQNSINSLHNDLNALMNAFIYQSQTLNPWSNSSINISSINISNPNIINLVSELSIPVVAVSTEGKGVVGNLTLKLMPGNNNVLINTNPFVDFDIQYSVNAAVAYAKLFVKNYGFDKDFVFSYRIPAQVVGGPSAGAATTILTIAALEGKHLKPGVAITGTINPDGSIGMVGGVLEKAKAVADAGFKTFLVPKGQSIVTYYEKVTEKKALGGGFTLLSTRYIPKTMDLKKAAKQDWGLNIVEVANVSEALNYFLE